MKTKSTITKMSLVFIYLLLLISTNTNAQLTKKGLYAYTQNLQSALPKYDFSREDSACVGLLETIFSDSSDADRYIQTDSCLASIRIIGTQFPGCQILPFIEWIECLKEQKYSADFIISCSFCLIF